MPARDAAAADAPHDSSPPAATVQIGEVARRIGLSIRTVRHWEDMGLVTPTARSAGGFRLYSEDDVARLRLLRFMKPLDLTLDEMRELMRIRELLAGSTVDESDRLQALVWPRTSAAGEERAELVEQLAEFLQRAEYRLEKLRAQVGEVEDFVERLRSEVEEGARGR